jgi:hypothetical protein
MKVEAFHSDMTERNGLMKIQHLKTRVIGPILLLIPIAFMHLGQVHHSGPQHSSSYLPSYPYSIRELPNGRIIERSMSQPSGMMAQEGTEKPPEGEKGD